MIVGVPTTRCVITFMRRVVSWLRSHGSLSILPSHSVFTDGSARELPRKRQCAGWRFEAMTAYPCHEDKPEEACGPVQTSADADFYPGATYATINIGRSAATVGSFVLAQHWCGEGSVTGIQCSHGYGGLAPRPETGRSPHYHDTCGV